MSPQTLLSFFVDIVREDLGVDRSLRMLVGVSFGYPEPNHPVNTFPLEKAPIGEMVIFLDMVDDGWLEKLSPERRAELDAARDGDLARALAQQLLTDTKH